LQLEGNTTYRAPLDALHQVGDEASNLVSHALGGNDGNLAGNSLVGVEVEGQTRVVLLDDDPRGLLNGLCSDTL
jgi:hypothetical protein